MREMDRLEAPRLAQLEQDNACFATWTHGACNESNKVFSHQNLLNLYSLLEKKYKIKFKSSELVNLTSIENILRIINGKINEKKKRK